MKIELAGFLVSLNVSVAKNRDRIVIVCAVRVIVTVIVSVAVL